MLRPDEATPGPPGTGTAPFVTRWDLDKTYLRSEFDTFRDLVRTAFERPEDKRAIPGAAAVLRELGNTGARVHILSGSPRQMRARLEAKLRLDRVRWDSLTLKPNLENLVRLRFRALRDQLGYKLPALLAGRAVDQGVAGAASLPEILVGDDAESDAFVYSLYADVAEGRVGRSDLERILHAGRLYPDQREACLHAAELVRPSQTADRILIHLDRQSPPSAFSEFGPRLVPFFNYLQAAFVLAEDGRLPPAAVLRIGSAFAVRHRFDPDALARSYRELLRRGAVTGVLPDGLAAALEAAPREGSHLALTELGEMIQLMRGYVTEAVPMGRPRSLTLDYVALAERHRGGRSRTRRPRLFR